MYENAMRLKQSTTYVEDGKIYLKLSYTYEGDNGTHEVAFPKIGLGFYTEQIPSIEKKLGYPVKIVNKKEK